MKKTFLSKGSPRFLSPVTMLYPAWAIDIVANSPGITERNPGSSIEKWGMSEIL